MATKEMYTVCVMHIIATLLNLVILKKEYSKRRAVEKELLFVSKSIKYSPIVCMISGTIYAANGAVEAFRSSKLCTYTKPISLTSIISQAILGMGIYQISVLYYCFSSKRIHSNRGYPQCLFILMITIGICICFGGIIFSLIFNDEICKSEDFFATKQATVAGEMLILMYVVWDIVTLALYIIKGFTFRTKFKTENIQIYYRIMFILKRIVFLSVIYEFFAVLCTIFGTLRFQNDSDIILMAYRVSWACATVAFNLSMYLMQQHNSDAYQAFVRFLYRFRVYHICFGCRDVFEKAGESALFDLEMQQNNVHKNHIGNHAKVNSGSIDDVDMTVTINVAQQKFPRNVKASVDESYLE